VDTIVALAHVAFSFSVHMLSTDLRAVSMTCDLRTEQTKRDRGKKYEQREEQWIRSGTWVNYDARGALIEIEAACLFLFRFRFRFALCFAAHRHATLFGATDTRSFEAPIGYVRSLYHIQ
jgi:hypothetical protein